MHPLFQNASALSDSEIEEKIMILNRRYFQSHNPDLQQQILSLVEDYKLELENRRTRQRLEMQQQQEENGEKGLDSLINIS